MVHCILKNSYSKPFGLLNLFCVFLILAANQFPHADYKDLVEFEPINDESAKGNGKQGFHFRLYVVVIQSNSCCWHIPEQTVTQESRVCLHFETKKSQSLLNPTLRILCPCMSTYCIKSSWHTVRMCQAGPRMCFFS